MRSDRGCWLENGRLVNRRAGWTCREVSAQARQPLHFAYVAMIARMQRPDKTLTTESGDILAIAENGHNHASATARFNRRRTRQRDRRTGGWSGEHANRQTLRSAMRARKMDLPRCWLPEDAGPNRRRHGHKTGEYPSCQPLDSHSSIRSELVTTTPEELG